MKDDSLNQFCVCNARFRFDRIHNKYWIIFRDGANHGGVPSLLQIYQSFWDVVGVPSSLSITSSLKRKQALWKKKSDCIMINVSCNVLEYVHQLKLGSVILEK